MRKQKKLEKALEEALELERIWTKKFIEESGIRGRAITILLPLIDQEDLTELLAELYDLRFEVKELKKAGVKGK